MLSSRSLRLGSTPSTTLTAPESAEILRNITKAPRIRMLSGGKKTWVKNKQRHGTSKGTTCDQSSIERLKANIRRYSFNVNSTPSLVQISSFAKIDQLNRNKSDPLNPNYKLTVNKGSKFLKALGSLTSIFSTTGTSVEEIPITPEMSGYCSPLDISFKSSATNIAYCEGRRFFSGIKTPHFPIICE